MEKLRSLLIQIVAFFDRSFNLLFRRAKCVKLIMDQHYFKYNDIIATQGAVLMRCVGNNWYVQLKIKRKQLPSLLDFREFIAFWFSDGPTFIFVSLMLLIGIGGLLVFVVLGITEFIKIF